MKAGRWGAVTLGAVLLLFALSSSFSILLPGQNGLLVGLSGHIVSVERHPGLYFHWPMFQQVRIVDIKLRSQNTRPVTVRGPGGADMTVNAFVQWRIADPRKFYRQGLSIPLAESRVSSAAGDVLGSLADQLIAGQKASAPSRAYWEGQFLERVSSALSGDGIHVVAVHVLETGLTQVAQKAMFQEESRHQAEKAKKLLAEGKAQAAQILAQGEKNRVQIRADAYRKSQAIIGQGQAQAVEIYASAYGGNPRFYSFYRSLEAYREGLKHGAVVVLGTGSPFLRYFHEGLEPSHP